MGKKTNWQSPLVHRTQGLFLSVSVDDTKMTGRKQNMSLMWKKWMKLGDLEEPTSFLDHVHGMCSTWMQTERKITLRNTEGCSNHEFLREQLRNDLGGRNLTREQSPGQTIWTVMRQKRVGRHCDLANKKNGAVIQSLNSLLGRPQLQEGGTGNGWRIVQSVLAD